ncbi:MAG: hypothetical protein RL136_1820 [Planctomycetota bacterium]|jgi:Tfp pilus assembly protein PilO
MMTEASKPALALLAGSVAALGAAVAFMLLPSMEASQSRSAESGRLLAQVAREADIVAERDRLHDELAQARADASRVLRTIPGRAEQAQLMRMLAVGTSDDMGTQTIVAGDPLPATPSGTTPYRAVPVTVDMKASFERIIDVLARAEGDRRLVRPIRVELRRPIDGDEARGGRGAMHDRNGRPLLEARLELDAVFTSAGGNEP